MREALNVIAEVTNSERLRQFLATGRDRRSFHSLTSPGSDHFPAGNTIVLNTSPEMPRGLNQLGNTCYLNSLLQYFYTIKDLRVAIASLAAVDSKFLDDSKFTDDDLKRHRVGGRLVTRREILRSKKCTLSRHLEMLSHSRTRSREPPLGAVLEHGVLRDGSGDTRDRAGEARARNVAGRGRGRD